MNSTTSNIFRKIADHIDYYYWNPPPGYPPRWLNVLIFTISLFLWLVAWTPIKVKTAEVIPLSPDNGDEVYIIERTGFGATSHGMQYSEWVRFKINDKKWGCTRLADMLPSEKEDNTLQIKEKSTERTTPFFCARSYCTFRRRYFGYPSQFGSPVLPQNPYGYQPSFDLGC